MIEEALNANNYQSTDIDLLIPHQANLRISQYIQDKMGLSDAQVFNNIMHYGNTTAATIPIAISEVMQQGKLIPVIWFVWQPLAVAFRGHQP